MAAGTGVLLNAQGITPRVFLAFHDFSLAGPHVLALANIEGLQRIRTDSTSAGLLSAAFADFVDVHHFAAQASDPPTVTFLVVKTRAVDETNYWALADALVSLVTDAHALTVVASLHLPYAKLPSSASSTSTDTAVSSVYYAQLNGSAASSEGDETLATDSAAFAPVDAAWALADRFLAALVHLLKVEQAPRTHFLLAKGYKPGRDHAGTYEAVDALAAALKAFTHARVVCDAATIKSALPRRLAERVVDVNASHESEHHALLYH